MSAFGEPWTRGVEDQAEIAAFRKVIGVIYSAPLDDPDHGKLDVAYSEIDRMVLCVNACAGISNEQLQAVVDGRQQTFIIDRPQ